jgi:DNA-binding CsgD family transcriptional regulator
VHCNDQIIELVYSAAIDAAAWPAAVRTISAQYRAVAAGLYATDLDAGAVELICLEGITGDCVETYVDQFLRDNPWSLPAMQAPGRVRSDTSLDEHYREPGYYRRTALYNEWMKPQDFIFTLGVNLSGDQRRQTKFFLYRPAQAGAYSEREVARFERLARHLVNAVRVAQRLGAAQSRAESALNVLSRLRFGVVFLDERGRITQANAFAEELLARRDGLTALRGTLVAAHRADASQLAGAIRAALAIRRGEEGSPTGAYLRRPSGRRPLSVTAVPLASSGDVLGVRDAAVALIVADPEQDAQIPVERLRRRFALTASEARVVAGVAQGLKLRDAADEAGVTYETARWYLKNAFQKTGTSRQADLVRLLFSDPSLLVPE